ncbi:hexose kinase [Microbacterium sp. zg.Y625]|uniref:1-phosphofructokinase family hexose kinase n=1 Tax=Microbacterium jiangjiandongii TaxID=3049071 RepID=UPI00214AB976|nr:MULTISPECIES: hexose kinase [unclassified Microbacterium]MCR2792196.1 hexose kinase [Microbacterium sp. zg.Y625]WIM24999.1 hexose kinase [Microbacterium sp. zg-Y625]
MILTVTPNPALDCTWRVERLVPGDSHRVPTGAQRAGGKGINVARVLTGAGLDAFALTTAGGHSGEILAADLRAAGIPHRLIPVAAATRRSIAAVDDATGETTLLNEVGAALAADESAALFAGARTLATGADVTVISGSLPPGIDAGNVRALVADIAASGVTTIADVTGPALLAAAEAGAHVVKPNAVELRETTGSTGVVAGARMLRDRGAGLVVVSLGADGMLFVGGADPHAVLRARLPRRLRGNATGAGDAAVAAIAAVLAGRGTGASDLSHAELVELARAAVAWSASAVLMPLAGELSPEREQLATDVIFDTDIRDLT